MATHNFLVQFICQCFFLSSSSKPYIKYKSGCFFLRSTSFIINWCVCAFCLVLFIGWIFILFTVSFDLSLIRWLLFYLYLAHNFLSLTLFSFGYFFKLKQLWLGFLDIEINVELHNVDLFLSNIEEILCRPMYGIILVSFWVLLLPLLMPYHNNRPNEITHYSWEQ